MWKSVTTIMKMMGNKLSEEVLMSTQAEKAKMSADTYNTAD